LEREREMMMMDRRRIWLEGNKNEGNLRGSPSMVDVLHCRSTMFPSSFLSLSPSYYYNYYYYLYIHGWTSADSEFAEFFEVISTGSGQDRRIQMMFVWFAVG
jgi:hypothetical protein